MAIPESMGSPILALGATLFFVRVFCRLVYNLYFHPLRRFPGPILAAASKLYESYFDLLKGQGGQYVYRVDRMHDIYGPIVRITPDELHIRDVEYFDTLYTLRKDRDKDPQHTQIFGTPLSLFGSELHEAHKARRSAINPFFSRSSVLRLEPVIKGKVQKMCDNVSESSKRGELVHLRQAFVAVTVDIVTEYSFAECAGTLDRPDFSPDWESMMNGVTEGVPLAKAIPGIVQVMQSLPSKFLRFINPLMGSFSEYQAIIRHQVKHVRAEFAKYASHDVERPKLPHATIFHTLLESPLPPYERSEERLTQEGIGLISAASETGSLVMVGTMFHVLSNPDLVTQLRQEINSIIPNPRVSADWRKLESLPLLTAVVKEGLRITTAISGRLPLVVREPLQYRGWTIPVHTSVSMSPRDALLDPDIFPKPKTFDPYRWLRPMSDEKKQKMQANYLPFNKGPRMCLGRNLAYANMYHNIAALIARFDLELVDTIRERDVDMARDHFVAKPTKGSQGIKIRVAKDLGAADEYDPTTTMER